MVKKIKILVICPIKADATSFYRGYGPLSHLAKDEHVELIDGTLPNFEISWDVVAQADVVFIQRPSRLMDVKLIEIAKYNNIPVWIDYDDDYFGIPETNPRYGLYADPHRRACIKACIDGATIITVSTPAVRDSIIRNTGKNGLAIHIIPNAIDETIFNTEVPAVEDLKGQRNIILWRGGDTHGHDIDPYTDIMVELYNQYPDYKWAFMGFPPEKLMKQIDTSRILLYKWTDMMQYMDFLFELRPKITIVPWADLPFNKSKSNCSWIESTLAGAVTIFPEFSSEHVDGMVGYQHPGEFDAKLCALMDDLLAIPSTDFVLQSFETLKKYTLKKVNALRLDLLIRMTYGSRDKLGFRNRKYTIPVQKFSDQQVFDYANLHHYIQEDENYMKGHHDVADWLIETFKPIRIVEIGCGPGAMLERFLDRKVPQVNGFDLNPVFQEYFVTRNPHYEDNYHVADITTAILDGVFDLCVSIEVFEHIPQDKIEPLLSMLADHFKVFYFSSTPFRESIRFDEQWGHISVHTHEKWIEIFERNGWKYVSNPQKITKHDHLFKSTRV